METEKKKCVRCKDEFRPPTLGELVFSPENEQFIRNLHTTYPLSKFRNRRVRLSQRYCAVCSDFHFRNFCYDMEVD
jgi:hypothetical protein